MATLLHNTLWEPAVLHYQYWRWSLLIYSIWVLLSQCLVYQCIGWWPCSLVQTHVHAHKNVDGTVPLTTASYIVHYSGYQPQYNIDNNISQISLYHLLSQTTLPLKNALTFELVFFWTDRVKQVMTQSTIPTSSSLSSSMASPPCLYSWQHLSSSVPRLLAPPRGCSLVCGMPPSASGT